MAKQQSPEQRAAFKALCRENNLDATYDVWQQKQSGQWIIGRTGIEKIQGHNNISVTLEVVGFGLDYAGVKATATRTAKAEGSKTAKKLSVESLGSAHVKNCLQISYYLEMAEKRAKSRAILMLMGFYALGVYGEDEADDFRRTDESTSLAAEVPAPAAVASPVAESLQTDALAAQFSVEGKGAEVPAPKPAAEAAAPASAPLAASTGADQNSAEHEARERVLGEIIKELASHHITPIERNRMMMGLNRLTLELAQNSLKKLADTIDYRASPDALVRARHDLRAFANANATALGQEEYNRLHLRAGALTVTAVDLIQEMQEAEQRLKTPQTAA